MNTSIDWSKNLSERQEPQNNSLLVGFDRHCIWAFPSLRSHGTGPMCVLTDLWKEHYGKGKDPALTVQLVLLSIGHHFSHPIIHRYGNSNPKTTCHFALAISLAPVQRYFPPCMCSKDLFVVLVLQEKPNSGLVFSVWWDAVLLQLTAED